MGRVFLVVLLVGCGTPAPMDDGGATDGGAPDGTRCLDDARYEACAGGACETRRCRGDELCQLDACVPWTGVEPSCGFELRRDAAVERQVLVAVDPGGFPRAQVEALRFDFGDGIAGYGEQLRHQYDAPGVYVVTLDVRMTGFRTCRSRQLAVIDPPADHDPLRLTVDEIPELLNGSIPLDRGAGPEPFALALPPSGWTVDVAVLAAPDDPVTEVTLRAGDVDVTDRLTFEAGDVPSAHWQVDTPFPEGPLTLTFEGTAASGRTHRRTLDVSITPLDAAHDPIDRPIVWLFRSGVDVFTTAREGDRLVSTPGANGLADLPEELALIGAQGPDAAANAAYLGWITEGIRREVYRTYGIAPDGTPLDAIPMTIFWEGEPGAPDPAGFSTTGDVSMMRFGGTFDGYVGFSRIAPWNEERVDDSVAEYGIATAGLASILTSTPLIADVFAPLAAMPVGTHPRDAEALDPAFDRFALDTDPELAERHALLFGIARYLALVFASVTAHEMGHAMGLMPNGVPPLGFFGNVTDVPFVSRERTNAWHADLPGLNLMQAGGDYLGVLDEALATLELPRGADIVQLAELLALENRLSAYSRAYMQGRLTYLNDGSDASGGLRVGCALY
ncbi:MAG: PKD domain-containing protein [Sandaracinaceae bacterium]